MNKQPIYDVDYFIRKFEAIPEDKWCTNHLSDHWGRKCANGYCGIFAYHERTEESHALFILFGVVAITAKYNLYLDVNSDSPIYGNFSVEAAIINDGETNEYQQPTPKQRILAALYDIKKMQQPMYEDLTKSLAILPEDKSEVDVVVKVKETVNN